MIDFGKLSLKGMGFLLRKTNEGAMVFVKQKSARNRVS